MVTLTRYLYIKEDVLLSLLMAILEKNRDEALFWAFELYYSGFEELTCSYLYAIYKQSFYRYNPKLDKYMHYWSNQGLNNPFYISAMVANLTSKARKFDIQYVLENSMPKELTKEEAEVVKETKLIISLKEYQWKPYETLDHSQETHWKILPKVTKYSTRKNLYLLIHCNHYDLELNQLQELHDIHWLYYASFSPLWAKRIENHHGTIDHNMFKVEFDDEDDLQNFYGLYGYEPDEQSRETRSTFCHLTKEKQLTRTEIAQHFGVKTKKITRKKKHVSSSETA